LATGRQRRERIERHLDQELIDDEIVGAANQQRVAVGLRARDLLRADVPAAPGLARTRSSA